MTPSSASELAPTPVVKIIGIGTTVAFITLLHYLTAPESGIKHVLLRELYIVPIILGGFWFGLRGGVATAVIVSLAYGPLVVMGAKGWSAHDVGNSLQIVLFLLIGGSLGWLTDRESAQQNRLREAENLAAVGRASAMIAHDLKTPLITIAGLAGRLAKKVPPESPEAEKIMVIREQTDRLEKLVRDMLAFARPLQLTVESADLCRLLAKAKAALSEISLKGKVEISLPAAESCPCHLDQEKMMQVFINLFANAIEASPPGETVSVIVCQSPEALRVDITDRGSGIHEALKEKIFEPFVTGKKKGTGLGLPICKKIVEAHQGKLEFRNNSEGGATFRVLLPGGKPPAGQKSL